VYYIISIYNTTHLLLWWQWNQRAYKGLHLWFRWERQGAYKTLWENLL